MEIISSEIMVNEQQVLTSSYIDGKVLTSSYIDGKVLTSSYVIR